MGSRSKLEKAVLTGAGKVHGTAFSVGFEPSQYKKLMKQFDELNKMTIRNIIDEAAKDAADVGVKATKRELAADITLDPKKIGKCVKRYAHGSALGMAVGVKISDTARPLSDFAFEPKKPKPRTAPIIEIYKGKKEVLSKGAFVAKMKTGHVGIYQREETKRHNIKQNGMLDLDSEEHIHINPVFPTSSVTGMFQANERANTKVQDEIWKTFQECVYDGLEKVLRRRNGN